MCCSSFGSPLKKDRAYHASGRFVRISGALHVRGATNLCPCGYYGDEEHECKCSPYQIQRYQSKIGGPVMDRIDIRIDVARIDLSHLDKARPGKVLRK